MKKTLFAALAFVMIVGVAIVLPLTSAHALEVFSAETETRIYKADKSFGGYFMPMDHVGSTHYLMDMMGNVVHQIEAKGGVPIFAPDGKLWSIGYIQDWDGNVLWDFVPTRDAPTHPAFTMHHDMKRIWNKKLKQYTQLINCNRPITQAEAVAAGADPSITYGNRLTGYDFVAEVNMAKQIVWEWRPWDHTVQNVNPAWPNYASDTKLTPGKLDINWRTDAQQPNAPSGFQMDWLHVNSIDYNEELDHVVINPKHFSTFIVVDHGKTFVSTTDFAQNIAKAAGPDGDIIYRFGNPSMYNAGKAPGYATEGDQQMYGSHNIQWIWPYAWNRPHAEAGDTWPDPATYTKSGVTLPGAGNFLIFDNGCYNPTGKRSRILEINPRIGASGAEEVVAGQYIWPDVAGYKTNPANLVYHPSKQLAWSYQSSLQNSFYSSYISSMMRLPNGNTSICSGATGHLFEVTSSGEVVWEYLVPGAAGPNVKYVESDSNLSWQINNDQYRGLAYFTFRHFRYGTDYPGFAGKNLTSKGTLTGLVPRLTGEGRTQITYPVYTGFGFGATGVAAGGGGGVGTGSGGGSGY
jgi:hypothetical protein